MWARPPLHVDGEGRNIYIGMPMRTSLFNIHGAIAQMHLGMKGPVFLFNQPESIKHIESNILLIAFESNPV